jgi:hypothetical protein
MKKLFFVSLVTLLIIITPSQSFAQRGSRSSSNSYKSQNSYISTPKSTNKSYYPSSTYEVGGTKYKSGETYKSSGLPKIERSNSAKHEYLKSQGYKKTPAGYEIDHINPLSKGGADKPYNMQLLPKDIHKQKTANERKK